MMVVPATTVNGPGGTWTPIRMGTWILPPPRSFEPRMKRTSTMLPLGCSGEVPTQ